MKHALHDPSAPLPQLIERAQREKYDGIELPCYVTNPSEARATLEQSGLLAACLAFEGHFTGNADSDRKAAEQLHNCLQTAVHLGCHLVKIADPRISKRQDIMSTIAALADWLRPLANHAADHGITLLLENGPDLATARALWLLAERLEHPAFGIYWHVDHSLTAGESAAVVIPTLNTRIRYVRMSQSDPQIISRLKGIGYQGWIGGVGKPNAE